MNILALDIATKVGWACRSPSGIHSGVLPLHHFDDDADKGLKFQAWLKLELGDMDLMATEMPLSLQTNTNYRLNGLCFVAHMTAKSLGIQRRDVTPNTIKKFATGRGNAKKAQVVEAVRSWGFDPQDDNEADAIALLHYVEAHRAAA